MKFSYMIITILTLVLCLSLLTPSSGPFPVANSLLFLHVCVLVCTHMKEYVSYLYPTTLYFHLHLNLSLPHTVLFLLLYNIYLKYGIHVREMIIFV